MLVFGSLLGLTEAIAEELDLSLVNMRFIKPLDESMVLQMAETHDYLVTLEDAAIAGGAGSAVLEYLNQQGLQVPLKRLGLSDDFPSHGSREQVLQEYGLDAEGIRQSIMDFCKI